MLKRIRKSDRKAFEFIFRKYFDDLHKYANFYVSNSQRAEDIVQDVFLKIWEIRAHLSVKSSLKAYLFRSVHNKCIQYLRHKEVEQAHESKQAGLEEARAMNRLFFETGLTKLFEQDIESLVEKGILVLPEKTREIYLLSRNSFLKYSEIASRFNMTEKSVEYHISRALDILRKYLKEYLPVVFLYFIYFFSINI